MKTFNSRLLSLHPQKMIDNLVPIVDLAGEVIMSIYRQADHGVEIKEDQSPLTQADLQANAILLDGLKRWWPNIPVLSEEGGDIFLEGVEPLYYWVVDPLDGTKEFIKRNGEFTVNVALIFNGDPVLGVVLAPALERMYVGYCNTNQALEDAESKSETNMSANPIEKKAMKRDAGKWHEIKVSNFHEQSSPRPIRVASSRSHPSPEFADWLKQFKSYEVIEVGSSLKFCMIAEGLIDIYPRFGPTYIWDTAAGHAVVLGAGGGLSVQNQNRLIYNSNKLFNPHFIVSGF